MEKKNQLFRIVAGLNPNEKAYFIKSNGGSQKRVLPAIYLFKLIDKYGQKADFREDQIIAKFTKEFANSPYPKTKSRLLVSVLDSLIAYDKKSNEVAKIYDYLNYATSLSRRKLFFDAQSVLEKAVKLAEELEQIELAILVKSKLYYYKIFTVKYSAKTAEDTVLKAVQEDIVKLRRKIDSETSIYGILHFQKSIGVPQTKEDVALLKAIKENNTFTADFEPPSYGVMLDLAITQTILFNAMGDAKSSLEVTKQAADKFRPSDKLRKKYVTKHLSLYDSLLQAALLSLDLDSFELYNQSFQDIETYGADDANLKLSIDLYLQGIYAIVGKQPELYSGLCKGFNSVREESFIPNYRKVSLSYYMAFGSFLADLYDESYDQIQWLKNNRNLGVRRDVEIAMMVMECLILLEKEEVDVLEAQVRNLYEQVRNRENRLEIEHVVIRLIKELIKVNGLKARSQVYKSYLEEIVAVITANPNEAMFLNTFDIKSWLESRIEGVDFKTVYFRNNLN